MLVVSNTSPISYLIVIQHSENWIDFAVAIERLQQTNFRTSTAIVQELLQNTLNLRSMSASSPATHLNWKGDRIQQEFWEGDGRAIATCPCVTLFCDFTLSP